MGLLSRWFGIPEPLNPPARLWIREHLAWLGDQFGPERLIINPIIEPTDAFFPDPYDATPRTLGPLFHRVCTYMQVDPETVQLELFINEQPLGLVTSGGFDVGMVGGTFQEGTRRHLIHLDERHTHSPMTAVMVLAHELAHLRLMGEGRVDPTRFDHELLTDLCSVYFGFGIFAANHPAYNVPGEATWPGTDIWRPEYMTMPMHAFTLAMIAQIRFEENPRWAKHLNSSSKAAYRQASAWLAAQESGA